ncbi:MAG: DUF4143 domain-containing protein [Bacteroidota bacterium]
MIDTGIYQRISGLDMGNVLLNNDLSLINKGSLAEMFVGLELLKYQTPLQNHRLFYWHREAKSTNAEVDYLFQKNEISLNSQLLDKFSRT